MLKVVKWIKTRSKVSKMLMVKINRQTIVDKDPPIWWIINLLMLIINRPMVIINNRPMLIINNRPTMIINNRPTLIINRPMVIINHPRISNNNLKTVNRWFKMHKNTNITETSVNKRDTVSMHTA